MCPWTYVETSERTRFYAEHSVIKRVSGRNWDKVQYLLEMQSGRNPYFARAELFETLDSQYVAVVSPNDSDDARTYFESLDGWQSCPGMYSTTHPSYFKMVDMHTTPDAVFERHMRKLVELNFEPVRDAFVTERELDEWLDQGPYHLLDLFLPKIRKTKRGQGLIFVETSDFIRGFTPVMGPMVNATQLARMLERPLTDSELTRIRRQKCWVGWKIRTPSLEVGVETRALSPRL